MLIQKARVEFRSPKLIDGVSSVDVEKTIAKIKKIIGKMYPSVIIETDHESNGAFDKIVFDAYTPNVKMLPTISKLIADVLENKYPYCLSIF